MAAPIGNHYAKGHQWGRPRMYDSVDQIELQIANYFEFIKGECREVEEDYYDKDGNLRTGKRIVWDREPEPATITGLALYLGFADKCSLYEYQENEVFTHSIKKARSRVEHEYEKKLDNRSPTGPIFALKNMGWKDRSEVDVLNNGRSFNLPGAVSGFMGAKDEEESK